MTSQLLEVTPVLIYPLILFYLCACFGILNASLSFFWVLKLSTFSFVFQVYSPGADDIMPHPGDALTQSHYSPKGGIYADAYYMGKKGLYHLNLLQLTDLVACSAVLHLEPDSPCYICTLYISFLMWIELSFFCLIGNHHYCSLVHETTKFIQEIIRASLVYVPEVSLSGLDSKPFHKQQFFSNTFKYYKATQVFSAVHKIYHFVIIGWSWRSRNEKKGPNLDATSTSCWIEMVKSHLAHVLKMVLFNWLLMITSLLKTCSGLNTHMMTFSLQAIFRSVVCTGCFIHLYS